MNKKVKSKKYGKCTFILYTLYDIRNLNDIYPNKCIQIKC